MTLILLISGYEVLIDAANNYRPVSKSTIESWIAKYGR